LEGYSSPEDLMVFSPHLYPIVTWCVCSLLGDANSFCVRLPGVLLWLGTLSLLFVLAGKIRRPPDQLSERGNPYLPLVACLFTPAVIIGACIVEIDQTILPLGVLLMFLAFDAWLRVPTFWRGLAVGGAFFLLLWCRLSAPLVLVPFLVGYALIFHHGAWRKPAVLLGILVASTTAFAITWYGYGALTGVRTEGIYEYLADSFRQTTVGERSSGFQKLALTIIYDLLWGFNPFLLALVCLAMWETIKAWRLGVRLCNVYLLGGIWLLAGFAVVGGALFGFPKYQLCALPLLLLGIAGHGSRKWGWSSACGHGRRCWIAVVFAVCVMAIQVLVARDALYALRAESRIALADGQSALPIILKALIRQGAVYGLVALGIWGIGRKKTLDWRKLTLIAAVALNAGMVVTQVITPYQHGYIYGDQGDTRAVAAFIREHGVSMSEVIAPMEVFDALDWQTAIDAQPHLFGDAEAFLASVSKHNPKIIAISPLIYQTSLVHDILSSEKIQKYLEKEKYTRSKIGSYYVWERRERD